MSYEDKVAAIVVLVAVAFVLGVTFVSSVAQARLPGAYIAGPLLGLWIGYWAGWFRVRLTAGDSEEKT